MHKVVVVGSINMDIVAKTHRFAMPGETVLGTSLRYYPGGKGANQAIAAARAEVPVEMVGAVGNDAFAKSLKDFLTDNEVSIDCVSTVADESCGTAVIIVDDQGENQIVFVAGANEQVSHDDIARAPIEQGDVVLCQFEVPTEAVEFALRRGRERGAVTVLNPAPAKPVPHSLLALSDILILNETELSMLSGHTVSSSSSPDILAQAVRAIRARDRRQAVVVTLGARGSMAFLPDHDLTVIGRRVDAVDTTAAGDCFVGSLGARLVVGESIEDALHYANIAASICVQRSGAGPSMPSREEVLAVAKKI